jgi:hypothetical protein
MLIRYKVEVQDIPDGDWRSVSANDLTRKQARELVEGLRQAGRRARVVRIEEHVEDE